MKAFAVIGYHHTGKTTLVNGLIKSLVSRGYKVATIKDIHHEQYKADIAGKNSWQHIQSGSQLTFARGLYDTALIFPKPLTLREMVSFLSCDYLIIEGMKDAPVPKILCAESEVQLEELYDDTVIAVSGKIAEQGLNWQEPKLFNTEIDTESLTELIIAKVFEILPDNDSACCSECGMTCYEMAAAILSGEKKRSDCKTDGKTQINLSVDGKNIKLVPFVQNLFRDILLSFIGNLKDVNPQGNITIEITNHG